MERKEELPLALAFAFTVSEFHASLSGCGWFIPPPACKTGAAFPRAAQKCSEWNCPSPGLGRDGRSSGGVRKSVLQLWSDQKATNYSSRRDVWTWAHKGFCLGFLFLVVVLDYLWASTSCLLSESRLSCQGTGWKLEVKADSAFP